MSIRVLTFLAAAIITASCADRDIETRISTATPSGTCSSANFTIDFEFPSAGQHSCRIDETGKVVIGVKPESDPPINCSPWFAFRVTPHRPGPLAVTLSYEACKHRYRPKTSTDFIEWSVLADEEVSVAEEGESATLNLELQDKPVFVAAQEILPESTYTQWSRSLEARPFATSFETGQSVEGRAIRAIAIGNRDAKKLVVVVGRQHPPEVTGALALFPFVETIASDHETARAYRAEVVTIVVPLLNPDGVAGGHWRHNARDTDLNRDWGPFQQPETRAMRDLIERYVKKDGKVLQFLIDFHSTRRDVFYTLPEELDTEPAGLTRRWLDRFEQRLPSFEVNRDPGHNPERPVSKAYAFEAYGVEAVTFEIGDETDRDVIVDVGQQSALAFMEAVLGQYETP